MYNDITLKTHLNYMQNRLVITLFLQCQDPYIIDHEALSSLSIQNKLKNILLFNFT